MIGAVGWDAMARERGAGYQVCLRPWEEEVSIMRWRSVALRRARFSRQLRECMPWAETLARMESMLACSMSAWRAWRWAFLRARLERCLRLQGVGESFQREAE